MPESFERFSSPARSAVAAAQDEAASLRHPRIHTEHLLLSLCADAVTVGMTLLRGKQTITPEAIRLAVIRHVGVGPDAVAGHLPWTPRAKRVLQLAVRESTELGDFYVGPEHLLLGLLREDEGVAAVVLKEIGWDMASLRMRVKTSVPVGRLETGLLNQGQAARLEAKIDHLTVLVERLVNRLH